MDSTDPAITALLRPRSIVIIGASSDPTVISGRPLSILRQHHYAGQIYLVNPRHDTIAGLPCYPDVGAVPGDIDMAVVCVPATLVPGVLEECARRGVAAAYVLSSGFGESGHATAGPELDRAVRAVAAAWPMRIAGPNAEGLYNIIDDLPIGFSPVTDFDRGLTARPPVGNIAVVAQSGGLGFGIFSYGLAQNLGFSHVVTTGNEVDLEVLDFVEYFLDDDETEVIVMFVEGFKTPDRLRRVAAEALRQGIPLVVAKVGSSAEGGRAAMSHTGHMTGSDELYRALFRHYGIIEANDMSDVLDITAALSRWKSAGGNRVGILTVSGGAGVWLTDSCVAEGLAVPELEPERQAQILVDVPYYAAVVNPVDITASGAADGGMESTLKILGESPSIDIVLYITSMASRLTEEATRTRWAPLAETVRALGKPALVYSYTDPAPVNRQVFAELGLPVYSSQRGIARAAKALADYGAALSRASRPVAVPPAGAPVSVPPTGSTGVLAEYQVKGWLRDAGLAVPAGRLVRNDAQAISAAEELGYPVALKLQSPELPHKSESGALVLGVGSSAAVRAAYARLMTVAASAGPGGVAVAVDGVLVEEMVAPGVEMLIGLLNDPEAGSFVAVGAGGTNTELLSDLCLMPAPVTALEALEAIRSLRMAPALQGFRGRAPADVDALAAAVSLVSQLGTDGGGDAIAELDLNPVVVHGAGQGIHVLDGLARMVGAPAASGVAGPVGLLVAGP